MDNSVKNYMATQLITFSPEDDIKMAMTSIVKNQISGAPVVDAKGSLVGIISEKDCIRTVLDVQYSQMPSGVGKVGEYMSSDVKTIDAEMTVMQVAMEFAHSPYRRFPVIEDGKLIGQVSRRDVLKAILKKRPEIKQVPSSWKGREPMD